MSSGNVVVYEVAITVHFVYCAPTLPDDEYWKCVEETSEPLKCSIEVDRQTFVKLLNFIVKNGHRVRPSPKEKEVLGPFANAVFNVSFLIGNATAVYSLNRNLDGGYRALLYLWIACDVEEKCKDLKDCEDVLEKILEDVEAVNN